MDDKIIKNFILKEDSLKEEIREVKREINDFYKNDILETKEYKALYKENFNLKNQVESLKSYMKDLEKKWTKIFKIRQILDYIELLTSKDLEL